MLMKSKKQFVDKTIRQIKPGVNKDIRKIIEFEENDGKPVRIGNFWNNNYIEYERNGNKNKENKLFFK